MVAFKPVRGHCQCGAVRFRITKPAVRTYHCHCSMCRRCHGTMFATYALAPRDGLVIESGRDNLATFASSKGNNRRFCKTCGCQVFIDVDSKPDLVWTMPGIMDGHPGHPPTMESHIYVDSKVDWYDIHGPLPQHVEGTLSPLKKRRKAAAKRRPAVKKQPRAKRPAGRRATRRG
ncbi:MAG: GFA family protein [Alphaproteobacteria bacterium]